MLKKPEIVREASLSSARKGSLEGKGGLGARSFLSFRNVSERKGAEIRKGPGHRTRIKGGHLGEGAMLSGPGLKRGGRGKNPYSFCKKWHYVGETRPRGRE